MKKLPETKPKKGAKKDAPETPSNVVEMNPTPDANAEPTTETVSGEAQEPAAGDGDDEPASDTGAPITGIQNADMSSPIPSATAFREVTCSRELKVPLGLTEREALIDRLIHIPHEIRAIEEAKKLANGEFKSKIERLEKEQTETGDVVGEGGRMEFVRCRWMFKVAGMTSDGGLIHHPEHKTLVRLDTREVVEVAPMKEADYKHEELNLSLDDPDDFAGMSDTPIETAEPSEPLEHEGAGTQEPGTQEPGPEQEADTTQSVDTEFLG